MFNKSIKYLIPLLLIAIMLTTGCGKPAFPIDEKRDMAELAVKIFLETGSYYESAFDYGGNRYVCGYWTPSKAGETKDIDSAVSSLHFWLGEEYADTHMYFGDQWSRSDVARVLCARYVLWQEHKASGWVADTDLYSEAPTKETTDKIKQNTLQGVEYQAPYKLAEMLLSELGVYLQNEWAH